MSVTLINPFEVPSGKEEQFLREWTAAAELMRHEPGFLFPAPPEPQPTGEIPLRQCRPMGIRTALPDRHEQRNLPESHWANGLRCLPCSLRGHRRLL